ncbi:KOW domain-containing RNA-binding protein [Paenibacillus aurantius]|uniref:KOW domain-containing RNA-binding protein n=1 Tax=Paenibacillus aurantius TaxID=2918900 RepID=A0AA96LHV5_9BACL|nr:KOW domain-containing RNA-binding protein [Paenibacillus aurantius]WJH36433.1 KOW domain-containing RNA-binding protein [Paenibacillus sp. CC-CFT747]WNQ11762.1 KOW domain-containing RNA-binding protein [Paenibacillus aurantius]
MSDSPKPQLGQIVKITRGRDNNKYAVIIGVLDSRFLLIADGDKRKFDQPKKKNILHLQLQDAISMEVVDSLKETGRVTNGKLRFAINKFADSQQTEAQEKGD